jgi:hypothetical protein
MLGHLVVGRYAADEHATVSHQDGWMKRLFRSIFRRHS